MSDLDLFYGKVKFGNLGFSIGKCSPIQVFVKDGGHYLSKSRRLEHIQLAKSLYVTNRRYFQKRKLVIDYPIYIT